MWSLHGTPVMPVMKHLNCISYIILFRKNLSRNHQNSQLSGQELLPKWLKSQKKLGCSAEKRFDYRVLAVLLVPSIRWWDYRKVDKSGSEKLSVDDEFLTFNRSCKILHHTARGTDPNY